MPVSSPGREYRQLALHSTRLLAVGKSGSCDMTNCGTPYEPLQLCEIPHEPACVSLSTLEASFEWLCVFHTTLYTAYPVTVLTPFPVQSETFPYPGQATGFPTRCSLFGQPLCVRRHYAWETLMAGRNDVYRTKRPLWQPYVMDMYI